MHTTLTENSLRANAAAAVGEQYSLAKILGIWASVALPMGLIHWVVAPFLIPRVEMHPGFLYLILITLGLAWQGVVVFLILWQEVKPFTWERLKERLWLFTPSNPRTGIHSKWLLLWTIPLIVVGNLAYSTTESLNVLWVKAFPFLEPPAHMLIQNLAAPAVGQWWLLGVIVIMIVFNYLLGEELIFRGILLPKMNGLFGKWDFLANNILFMAYHLHKVQVWPQILLINWIWPWAAKRFKSYWMALIPHGSDAPYLIFIVVMAILGLIQ